MDNTMFEILDILLAPLRSIMFAVLWPFYLIFGAIMLWGGAQAGEDE